MEITLTESQRDHLAVLVNRRLTDIAWSLSGGDSRGRAWFPLDGPRRVALQVEAIELTAIQAVLRAV